MNIYIDILSNFLIIVDEYLHLNLWAAQNN